MGSLFVLHCTTLGWGLCLYCIALTWDGVFCNNAFQLCRRNILTYNRVSWWFWNYYWIQMWNYKFTSDHFWTLTLLLDLLNSIWFRTLSTSSFNSCCIHAVHGSHGLPNWTLVFYRHSERLFLIFRVLKWNVLLADFLPRHQVNVNWSV